MAEDGQDEPSLEALYGVLRADLLRFLIARTGSAGDAEDLVQELWLKLRQPGSGPILNGRGYIYRMAQNLVVDRLREKQRRMRRDRLWSDVGGQHDHSIEPADPSPNAEQEMLDREETALLASALQTLPDGARRAFELHKIEGLSHAEVAARLGISKSGVEKHMAVAMKYLRRAMLD
jgi:RNA polymerase sigma-70 factor (ECF subfamily)